jgi:hypothetical protein
MPEQSVGFLTHEILEGRGKFEVDAGHDQILVVLSVHGSAFVLGCPSRHGAGSRK